MDRGVLRSKPHRSNRCRGFAAYDDQHLRRREDRPTGLTRMFHELFRRDHEDGRATEQPQGVGPEAYLNGTSQGPTPEDARKDGLIRGRSKRFMKHPGCS